MSNFAIWWQTLPSQVSPVIFSIGPVPVRWYGVMYLVAFVIVYLLVNYRIKHDQLNKKLPQDKALKDLVENMLTWGLLGVLVGGRFGYVIFYDFARFISNPLSLVLPFDSNGFTGIAGMSFHGGLIGVAIAFFAFCRIKKISFTAFSDLFIPAIPLGYMFGRIGNWLNGELWGRVTDSSIGQYFIAAPGDALRHPSQLYEAFGEGLVLFLILWPLRNKKWTPGTFGGLFIAGYGIARFIIEYYREPDAHIGFVLGGLSMGQVLSGLMVLVGLGIVSFLNLATKKPSKS